MLGGGRGGGGSLHINVLCPLRETSCCLRKPAERRALTGEETEHAEKSAAFGIIWTLSAGLEFSADSRFLRVLQSGPRGATTGGSEGNHIWSKYSLLSPSGTVRL